MVEKYVSDVEVVCHPSFDRFVATIEALRAVDGCPWDREQTHGSIAHNMIEEAYEAVDAIEAGNTGHLREELGDVLLQVVLQSRIAEDAGEFTIDEVCADIDEKIVRRHPHVFGEATAQNANDVAEIWEQVKLAEKESADTVDTREDESRPVGLLDNIPSDSPALMQAQKISRQAVSVGFEWESIDAVWDKVAEEIDELKQAYDRVPHSPDGKVICGDDETAMQALELEMGDVLFTLVNVARRMGIDAEESLRSACSKFRHRWSFMEETVRQQGGHIEDLNIDDLEQLWKTAKTTGVLS